MSALESTKNSLLNIKSIFIEIYEVVTDISRWKVFLFIVLSAGLMILYVSNVISIKKSLMEIQALDKQLDIIKNSNKIHSADIIHYQSPDIVIPYASEKLGMVLPNEAPTKLTD